MASEEALAIVSWPLALPSRRGDHGATMNDRTPTGDQQEATVAPTVTVREAAQILGVSTDAVRAKLRRGTLGGEKIDGEWHVRLPGRQDATVGQQDTTGHRLEEQQATDRTPIVDFVPLVDHIAGLERQVQQLTEAATVWQFRALQAEERLQQLTAGDASGATKPPRRRWWHRLVPRDA
jgi:excisionase family DNA binding protein